MFNRETDEVDVLKANLHRLSKFVDNFHKRSQQAKSFLKPNEPAYKEYVDKMDGQLRAIELIAQQMEKLFKVTVLTEPRE